jgi:predicted lipase
LSLTRMSTVPYLISRLPDLPFSGTLESADVFGFVATDPSKSLIVVSFRGSDSIRNWIANVEIDLVNTPICSSCKVHDGFNNAWLERQASIVAAVNSARAAQLSYGLVITGHSLGGAVATLAGAYFRSIGINCDIYTYGSPRVGNDAFANYASSTSQGSTSRITHLNDPVPHLPPGGSIAWLTDYYHTTPEYWLSDGTATTDNYAIGDIEICTGINNQDCAGSVNILDWDVIAHGHYFEMITGCDPTFTYK